MAFSPGKPKSADHCTHYRPISALSSNLNWTAQPKFLWTNSTTTFEIESIQVEREAVEQHTHAIVNQ